MLLPGRPDRPWLWSWWHTQSIHAFGGGSHACRLHFYLNSKIMLVIQQTGLKDVGTTSQPRCLLTLMSIQLEYTQKFAHFPNLVAFSASLDHL